MLKGIKQVSDKKGHPKFKYLFIGYTLFLLVATLFPAGMMQSDGESWISRIQFKNEDKVIHFALFFIFTILLCLSAYTKKNFSIWLIPILLGLLIECLQAGMNMGRTFDVLDILANSIGAISAWALLKYNRLLPS